MYFRISKSRKAFTLIELLVVMAIIGLLMAITSPILLSAIKKAKATKTKLMVQNVAAAVELFNEDYGYLPIPEGTRGSADQLYSAADSQQIIQVLMAEDAGWNAGHQLNYKQTVYLSLGTVDTDGTLEDAWGSQILFLLDRNLDERITIPGVAGEYRKRVIVISPGEDEDVTEIADNITNVVVE